MDTYDPLEAPDSAAWLALDEGERIALVEAYHRKSRIKLPNVRIHATVHVMVENQVALGDEIPVRATLERLQRQGLARHDAIHAIAGVFVEHLNTVVQAEGKVDDLNAAYYKRLESLTPASWRAEFG
jgi:hypothetical protein